MISMNWENESKCRNFLKGEGLKRNGEMCNMTKMHGRFLVDVLAKRAFDKKNNEISSSRRGN